MKVVILAGGRGSRLAELTEVVPKPMVQIGERPILWHIMKHFAAFGHREFVLALGYKGYVIKEFFLQYKLLSASLTVDLASGTSQVHDEDICDDWKIHLVETGVSTGTGGRLHRLRRWLNSEPFMLTYGDGPPVWEVGDCDRGSSAVALRRSDLRKLHRHRLRREAADRRRLDQRRLHDVRAGCVRLHGRHN
jgi:glucose-1-phosphate cytidylyltransferase